MGSSVLRYFWSRRGTLVGRGEMLAGKRDIVGVGWEEGGMLARKGWLVLSCSVL